MSRISSVVLRSLGLSRLRASFASVASLLVACCALALFSASPALAQTSEATLQGTVTDSTGANIRGAKVTATNLETGVKTTRTSNGTGDYSITQLQAGHYNVDVAAKGFQGLQQQDIILDSLQVKGLNLKLTVGSDSQTVTVTDAPDQLDTQDGSVGGTIENELYTSLPLSMGGSPRDPTAFAFLMPGVQESAGNATGNTNGTGTFGGSGQEGLNENYVNGVPVSNISAQGDPAPIRNALSVDAVDQFSVKTNGASTGFGGVGVTNYTIKSGGQQFHGTGFEYIRNTAFDTWGYFSKVPLGTGYAIKPAEHQNSFGGSFGGPILRNKLFFFGTYEGFHYTKVSNTPQYLTVPTLAERRGDFTDYFGTGDAVSNAAPGTYGIFDPHQSRSQFHGLLNGQPTFNVIPKEQLSPQALYLQSALPAPTKLATQNNYLAGLPLQNSDYTLDVRVDYTINASNKFDIIGIGGNRGYGGQPRYSNLQELPFPYAAAVFTNAKTASGILTYTYVFPRQTMINSLKYGYSRTWGEAFSTTVGTQYTTAKAGIKNTPPGTASDTFPSVGFAQGNTTGQAAPTSWASLPSSGPVATNSYTLIDNFTYIKGRHNLTFGLQIQWLETNAANFGGYSGTTALNYNGYSTENLSAAASGTGGSAYASYLIGAVYSGSVRTQTITTYGGRFKPVAPYVQDDWRVNSRLTLNLGFRYDYLQPYHEAQDRISFINPDVINPITGTLGVVDFAGFGKAKNPLYDDYICQCRTPVRPYNKNFEPRLGFSFAAKQNTVIRGSVGIMNTHAGGTGGGAGATQGTGNNSQYTSTTAWSQPGSTSFPSFYLNSALTGTLDSIYTQQDNGSLPQYFPAGNNVNPLSTTGNYTISTALQQYACAQPTGLRVNPSDPPQGTCGTGTQTFADPYYGGRGPQYINYNIGFQQMINKKAVISVNYVGSQTHFLRNGAGRGYATNGISPDYSLLLGCYQDPRIPGATGCTNLLSQQLSPTVISQVQSVLPNFKAPYDGFTGPQATVLRALSAFPQYNGFSDIWGETGNAMYNSLQLSVVQRPWHNLSGFANYTRSKTMDDTGNHRSQYPVGPADGNFDKVFSASKIDRSLSTANQTNAVNVTFAYQSPIGRGQAFFGTNRFATAVGGGWQLTGIYKYRDGNPLQITRAGGCPSGTNGGQGTCLPDYAPGFNPALARINGRYGRGAGANAGNVQNIQYLNTAGFICPDSPVSNPLSTCVNTTSIAVKGAYKIGNIARSAPYNLTGPGWWDVDMGIRRTFSLRERGKFHLTMEVEADVINVTNSTFFNLAGSSALGWGVCSPGVSASQCSSSAFGTIGGQNQNVPPRDMQFDARFRF